VVVVLHPAPAAGETVPIPSGYSLTRRELQVASLLAEGRSTKEIAATLEISPHTARHHTEHVFEKLGVRSRSQFILLSCATKLLTSSLANTHR
jgi:DNA-binding CsgD family transcriptional regulator